MIIKVLVFVILLYWISPGVSREPDRTLTELDLIVTVPAAPVINDAYTLHNYILAHYDNGEYADAARLLLEMKTRFPNRYQEFPYELLHAKTLYYSRDFIAAYPLFYNVTKTTQLARYAILPMAHISALQEKPEVALRHYKEYLSDANAYEYFQVALEAADYATQQNRPADLESLSHMIRSNSSNTRLGQFYWARARRLKGETMQARLSLQQLIQTTKPDDITSRALIELAALETGDLTVEQRAMRAEIAFDVWNYDLVRSYLDPITNEKLRYAYVYSRALYFQNDLEGSKRYLRAAMSKWPNDPAAKQCLYQLANIELQQGDFVSAERNYRALRAVASGETLQNATMRLIQALRAQSKFDEALALVSIPKAEPAKSKALFLRARINYQAKRYSNALAEFETLLRGIILPAKELMMWKALTLEQLGRITDAENIYHNLSQDLDFFGSQARKKLGKNTLHLQPVKSHFCILPDHSDENEIRSDISQGEYFTALLYLHLYDEAAQSVTTITGDRWNALSFDPNDRQQKYLEIAHIAGLGKNYPAALNYSEIYLKTLPPGLSAESLGRDVLEILFPLPYKELIHEFAGGRGVDPLFVLSIMKQESRFKRFARSPVFARGLMQLIPPTAKYTADDAGLLSFSLDQLYEPDVNINLGTKYLQNMIKEFGNHPELLAASYNGGELNVRRWLACTSSTEMMEFFSNIDLGETKAYVMIVQKNYEMYKRAYPEPLRIARAKTPALR